MSALRLLFFGTPEIAVPTLERLIAGPHQVVGVVSQPDRGRGRGRKESPSPVADVALREAIPLVRRENIGDEEALSALRALRPDVGIVVAFGQFLPKKIRELPSCGYLINAHASLLPKYRGASPIAQAILEGETETGVSIMRVEREMDSGPVALVVRTAIEARENTAELSTRLSEIAASAIEETLVQIERKTVEWKDQDASRATLAPKLEKSDALLDLRDSAQRLACRIHALSPKPGGSLTLVSELSESSELSERASAGSGASGRREADADSKVSESSEKAARSDGTTLKVSRADVFPFDGAAEGSARSGVDSSGPMRAGPTHGGPTPGGPPPGTIELGVDGCALRIATGDGWLVPLTLQRPGGKPLATKDFLRGFSIGAEMGFALPSPDEGSAK